MSHSCSTDIVRFIAHNVFEGRIILDQKNTIALICEPDTYLMKEFDWQTEDAVEGAAEGEANDYSILIVNGWKYEGTRDIGKRQRLSAYEWSKDGETCFTLNESQYNNVGEEELSVTADYAKVIEKFCLDNNLTIRFGIEENDTALQWG